MRSRATRARFKVSPTELEHAYERYGEEFAGRLRSLFGERFLEKSFSSLNSEEIAGFRKSLGNNAQYQDMLNKVYLEFKDAAKREFAGSGATGPKAVAKIIMYSERSIMREWLGKAGFETGWKNVAAGIRELMQGRIRELENKERDFLSRQLKGRNAKETIGFGQGLGASVELDSSPLLVSTRKKIAEYRRLLSSPGGLNSLILDSIAKSDDMKGFFSNLFGFDEGFKAYLRKNAGKLTSALNPPPVVWRAAIRMKFIPEFILKGSPAARKVQEQEASRVVEKIIAKVGNASEVVAASGVAREGAAKAFSMPKVAGSGTQAGVSEAKRTAFMWAPEISQELRAKVLGAGKKGATAGVVLAALSLAYMFMDESGKSVSQAVPKKVK
jgi:hypothetical protein